MSSFYAEEENLLRIRIAYSLPGLRQNSPFWVSSTHSNGNPGRFGRELRYGSNLHFGNPDSYLNDSLFMDAYIQLLLVRKKLGLRRGLVDHSHIQDQPKFG